MAELDVLFNKVFNVGIGDAVIVDDLKEGLIGDFALDGEVGRTELGDAEGSGAVELVVLVGQGHGIGCAGIYFRHAHDREQLEFRHEGHGHLEVLQRHFKGVGGGRRVRDVQLVQRNIEQGAVGFEILQGKEADERLGPGEKVLEDPERFIVVDVGGSDEVNLLHDVAGRQVHVLEPDFAERQDVLPPQGEHDPVCHGRVQMPFGVGFLDGGIGGEGERQGLARYLDAGGGIFLVRKTVDDRQGHFRIVVTGGAHQGFDGGGFNGDALEGAEPYRDVRFGTEGQVVQGDLVGYGKFRFLDFALGVAHQRKQGGPRIPDIQRFDGSGHGLLCRGNIRHADVFEDKMVVHQRIGNIPELHVGILWSLGRPCADGVNDGVFKIAHPAVPDGDDCDNGDAEANEAFLEFGQSHGFPRRRFDGHPCEAWKEQQCRYGLPPGQGNHPGNGREIKEENAKRPRGEEPGAVLRARRVRRSARFG